MIEDTTAAREWSPAAHLRKVGLVDIGAGAAILALAAVFGVMLKESGQGFADYEIAVVAVAAAFGILLAAGGLLCLKAAAHFPATADVAKPYDYVFLAGLLVALCGPSVPVLMGQPGFAIPLLAIAGVFLLLMRTARVIIRAPLGAGNGQPED